MEKRNVYLELQRRSYKVNIGKLGEQEVDFVAAGPEDLCYYQVSASVLDENTLRRELDPLKKIKDNHPKYLLTLDDVMSPVNHDGIRQTGLIEWLLNS
jgi:predicted AAA+ superfamily ATPase